MQAKKLSEVFVIAAFAVFLLAAMAASLLREQETYSYFENRNLAVMPKMTKESVLSGEYFSDVEDYLKDHAAGRNTLLKLDTYINMDVLRLPVVNEVVVKDNILLPFNEYETVDKGRIAAQAEKMADNLEAVDEVTRENGGVFYYVLVPCQYAYFEDEYPWYLNNRQEYTDTALPAITAELSERDISLIDVGAYFEELGNPPELGSTVDNHYPMLGAYLAYVEIMERINADTGYDLTILRDGDFTISEVPNHYIGSRTRKLFDLWDGEEKLSILTPEVEVPFLRYDNGNENTSVVYSLPYDSGTPLTYNVYMGGDIPEMVIDTGRDELPSVLIYGDSFTNAVETVLYYGFDEMRSLDLRYYKDMTLGEYIETYKPDIVICLRNYGAMIDTTDNGLGPDGY
ncbi:MAG: hypothetical protein ACI3VB_02540 [Oscillospiraceae bacterium]